MPKPQETCIVEINGQEFRDWETVSANANVMEACRKAVITVTEAVGANGAVGQALQIKPGDACTIKLAGQTFLTGVVQERQVAYDANNHAVRISAVSTTQAAVRSSIPLKDGNFKGYSFQAIANKVLKQAGVSLKVVNPPAGWDKAFPYINASPGETVWELLSRLAPYRGIWLHDDESGNLVVHGEDDKNVKHGLVEGRNILSANCVAVNPDVTGPQVVGQNRGTDNTTPDQNRGAVGASAKMNGANYAISRTFLADIPADTDDLKRATQSKQLMELSQQVTAQIVTQGWLRDDGSLWTIRDFVHIDSPMLILDTDSLQIADVTFTQDPSGTRTTIVAQKHLGSGVAVEAGTTSAASSATTPNITPGTVTIDGPKGQETVTVN